MMRLLICFAFLVATYLPFVAFAGTQEIVAVVNDDAITRTDLEKRMKLIMASSGLPDSPEIRQKLAPQVINGLIDERVMIQQSEKLDLIVSQQEVENGFTMLAQQNKMDADKFKAMLKKGGIDLSTMEAQVKAQISWGKVVQKVIRPKVIVSERDVDDALGRIKSKVGATEFLTAEIFLPFDSSKKEEQSLQLANKMVGEIKRGKASFFKLAQQFSKSAGSSKGGDMGWLRQDQMAPEFLSALKGLQKNQVSKPIRTAQGVHILYLRDTRNMSNATLPSRQQIYEDLGTERLERAQRSYLRTLRSSSFVEIRV